MFFLEQVYEACLELLVPVYTTHPDSIRFSILVEKLFQLLLQIGSLVTKPFLQCHI